MAKQLEMMYEGKAKQVFATDDPTLAVIHYKDDATAFNGLKKGTIVGKGVVNNLVSNHLLQDAGGSRHQDPPGRAAE